ncbi:MAG: glycosyltransferase family 4 protein [Actinobacteria bacterium]|nr:glycosyltransferase family 4 protein [Actinomycetota bacterium]
MGIDGTLDKYSPWKRIGQERAYARRLNRRVAAYAPHVVVSSNNPLFSQQLLLRECRRRRIPFVFWQQDLYSVAMKRVAEDRVPLVGRLLGNAFVALERRLLARSDAIVAISPDFSPTLERWGLEAAKVHVIENWAPLNELPLRSRDNAWACDHGLAGHRVILYSGTLGLKHNPDLLLQLALAFRRDDVRTVVVSEGPGADWLREHARDRSLENLIVLGYQPYERLADVLASGDILAVILEPEAGGFSVPSKVLSYHCAGRPLLAAIPHENLAARVISGNESGVVVDPRDAQGFVAAAKALVDDEPLRERLGRNARAYAEATFDITAIGDRFEHVLAAAAAAHAGVKPVGDATPAG